MSSSFQRSVIEEFRAHGGRVGGPFEGADLLLLTTTGARSGLPRTTPLGYVRHGGALLVVASNLGAPHHPAWYHNLLARPVVRVEVGTGAFEALAVPAEGARRAELFREVVRVAPGYGAYQAATARELPVVELATAEPEGWAGPREVRTLADKILEVHAWLRGQLRQVAAETEAHFAAREAQPGALVPGLGLQIRQRCLAFCQTLRFHHDGEDGHVLPVMAVHHPELAEVFARLGKEHRVIAGIQERLAALLTGVGVAEPERFRGELRRMSAELLAHLAYEEETVVPLLTEVPWPPAPGGRG
ncbi:nitroreductase/quinone reductase family protein [Streptomyces catenulae]|uniref:Nitroreductase/quinone reductase family protein n=1 Tax=Streptomyces catenulae TaxID=66875 RepID=A0ABV2Z7J7_9ACTN|nr:nitroreductase/quinone reductase family protein [Streptomyces catenulae]